jgi:hypothetical protein
MSRQQNIGQNHYLLVANKSCQNVANLKSLVTTATNKNYIQEGVEMKLKYTGL